MSWCVYPRTLWRQAAVQKSRLVTPKLIGQMKKQVLGIGWSALSAGRAFKAQIQLSTTMLVSWLISLLDLACFAFILSLSNHSFPPLRPLLTFKESIFSVICAICQGSVSSGSPWLHVFELWQICAFCGGQNARAPNLHCSVPWIESKRHLDQMCQRKERSKMIQRKWHQHIKSDQIHCLLALVRSKSLGLWRSV